MRTLFTLLTALLSIQVASAQECTQVEMISTVGPRTVLATYLNQQNDDCYEARKQCRMDSVGRSNVDCERVMRTIFVDSTPNVLPLPRIGDTVVVEGHQNNSVVRRVTLSGAFEVQNLSTQTLFVVAPHDLGVTNGCQQHALGQICTGNVVIMRGHQNNSVVEAHFRKGTTAIRNLNTQNRFYERLENLAVTNGCLNLSNRRNLCVGDTVRAVGHQYLSRVEGLFSNGEVVIRNTNTGNRYIFSVSSLQ
jgi:hypothetical protein